MELMMRLPPHLFEASSPALQRAPGDVDLGKRELGRPRTHRGHARFAQAR